ncbi:DUF485 domain-containing protein [Leucobacter aridicollis]|uniref:Uncharacterized membrane protein (DUF485 family) n=1 Tax=Leucobacter aridicollis TaxID=283878 RepID=A0A852RGU9_9MICO|nr:DUF485 domain-containing protein [Leucobacter aridicollis]MBL3681533.1 DUF485 domain-containing protein [Leucobacter aridicollis]NYD27434.1 uncharacterized membrane protein (DUF485 family) [Leucobacter aridicollis]
MSEESVLPAESGPDPIDYEAVQASPEFQQLRSKLRKFVFPLAAAFLVWFLLYVFLGAFAHEFMATPLLGMNVGLWFGLLQFVSTFAITTAYVMYTNRNIDPLAEALRADLEQQAARTEGDTP